jgi:N-acetylglucosamine-6-phosphate deacetylase
MATLTPARIAGVEAELGSIELGKKADLVVTDRHLNVRAVYIDGLPPPH